MIDPSTHTESMRASGPRNHARLARLGACLLAVAAIPCASTHAVQGGGATAGIAELGRGEDGRFRTVSWDLLSGFPYDFEIPGMLEQASKEEIARRSREIIPARVRALDGQLIALRGYVIPTEMEGDVVRSFILAAKNEVGCCFGAGLSMNQWVAVEVPEGDGFRCDPFVLATVLGKIEVGEEVEDGWVLSLYRMAAQKIRKG